MREIIPDNYYAFEDYVEDVVYEEWLKVIADDWRVWKAVTLRRMISVNGDITEEANLLASVAEQFDLDPETVEQLLDWHDLNTVGSHE